MSKTIEVQVDPVPDDGEVWVAGSLVAIRGQIFRIVSISDDWATIALRPFHGFRWNLRRLKSWLRWQLTTRVP